MSAKRAWLFADYNQAESRVVAWRGPVPKLRQWYSEGQDVHLHVTQLIARTIQENRLTLPGGLFTAKPWHEYAKGDEEREQAKRIVHGYNYKIGKVKIAQILRLPETVAETLMRIYGTLFPEIASNYHAWIESQLRRTRTLWMPPPVQFRKVFWDQLNDDTRRAAYATYPQCTVASMLNRTIELACTIFERDETMQYRDQWCAWYGTEYWDTWCALRARRLRTPQAVLWGGMDVRLNAHDAGGISIPDDPDLIRWAAQQWRRFAEEPIWIEKDTPLVIPVDFKKGDTWGTLHDYKLD